MEEQRTNKCFLGIECTLEEANIVIQPVPFDKTTTYVHGTDKGPQAIIEASRYLELYDIETESEVYAEGIHTADEICSDISEEMIEATHKRVEGLLSHEKFVVTVGGEHSISLAPIKAHAEKYGPITLLQFDAHTDLALAYEGNPHSHGSVMARVKEVPAIENIISVGIRSMAKNEVAEMDKKNVFFAHQLDGEEWMDQVVERLGDRVYVTFDIDVFDPGIVPSTGTPEPGGIFWNQAMKLLKKVVEQRHLVGFDLVELCPIPEIWAPDFLAAKLIYKILSYKFRSQRSK